MNMKRNFYLDVNTILNRILLRMWAICAFRVLNPHQWPLSKKGVPKVKSDVPKMPNQVKAKRDSVINPQNVGIKYVQNMWVQNMNLFTFIDIG